MTTTLAISQHVADYRAGKISGLELSGTFDVLADWLADPEYGGRREWIGGGVVAEWDKQLGDWLAVPGPDRRAEYASTPWTCPPHLARLVAWRLRMEDERWHGTEDCPECAEAFMYHSGREARTYCASCEGSNRVPTFALLFDRPCPWFARAVEGEVHHRPSYQYKCVDGSIPGHLSELVAWLRASGDAKADEIAGMRVERASVAGGWEGWRLMPPRRGVGSDFFATYPDACRELIRRVGEVLCEECVCRSTRPGHCVKCHGLGFVGRVK